MPLQPFVNLQGETVSSPQGKLEAWKAVFAAEFSNQVKTLTREDLRTFLQKKDSRNSCRPARCIDNHEALFCKHVRNPWSARGSAPSVPGVSPGYWGP